MTAKLFEHKKTVIITFICLIYLLKTYEIIEFLRAL